MTLDVEAVRRSFPSLAQGVAYFDGPGGSQVPAPVAQAVADAMLAGMANRGQTTAGEKRADVTVVGARHAMADLLGAQPQGVIFGRSMTQLTYDLSRALARQWRPGDEVVVTRLDHDANIRPWVQAAERVGATVRWAAFDPSSGELPVESVAEAVSPRTRLVAVTAASNLLGTRPDIAAIADVVHAAGALLYVDGVHLTPHAAVDVNSLGADFFACSPYKFFGPHLGAVAADPALLDTLEPDKLLPSTDEVPERFELGTLPYELLAGTTATVDFIADLAPAGASDGRRGRVLAAMAAVEAHEDRLFARLRAGLDGLSGVTRHARPASHTPTLLFSLHDLPAPEVHRRLAARGVNAPAGSFYAIEASRWAGLGDSGAVRVGLSPYNHEDDVDRLLDGVSDLCR